MSDVPRVGKMIGDEQSDNRRERLVAESRKADSATKCLRGEGFDRRRANTTEGFDRIGAGQVTRVDCAWGTVGTAIVLPGCPVPQLLLAPDDMPGDIADRPLRTR